MGLIEGRTEGEIIGKIHLAQRLLKRPTTPKKKLLAQSHKELRAILKKLEVEFEASDERNLGNVLGFIRNLIG